MSPATAVIPRRTTGTASSRSRRAPGPAFRFARRIAGLRPSAIREILKTTESPEIISFAGGLPAPELFPVDGVRSAAAAVLDADGPGSLQYSVTEGYRPLREWVCDHLADAVGLRAHADQVLITHGSQQALDLLGKVLLDPGDVVLVENPAYLGALQAFRSYEARVVGLPADAEGLEPEALRRALRSTQRAPKFIYVIPNFQNPSGTSTSAGRRITLAGIAAEFGVPVVEDDPYGRLRYAGTAAPALAATAGRAEVIYLGTTSKILAPGLRVGWMVAPDPRLFDRLVTAKQSADLHTSTFTQRLAWHYLRDGRRLESHLQRLRRVYAERREVMLAALAAHLPETCTWTHPDGGLFLWVRLPEAIDATELLRASLRRKVAFVPGEPFWVGRTIANTLRLNFSNSSPERIEEGIRRLGTTIKAARPRSSSSPSA